MSDKETLRHLRSEIMRHRIEVQEREKKLKAKQLRTRLVQQMTEEYNLDFIVYYLTEEHLDIGNGNAPIVTVVTAWDKDGEPCDNKYTRGVAICSHKDAPSRLDGFNMAARRLLRAVKDGLAPIHLDPDNERLLQIWDSLRTRHLVTVFHTGDEAYLCACSHSSELTPLETCVLQGREQRRKDRDARRQEHDKIKNGLIAGVMFPSDDH